ncbi:hypothetical protein ABVT39_023246 [Epinephelus coioides]
MAGSWRTPRPDQQNQGDQPVFWYQQQGPRVMRPPHPPSYPGTSLPPPAHPPELPLDELYNHLHTPQPAIQTLNHPPSTSLIRYLLSRPNPEPVAGPSYAGTCPESLNPTANASSQGGQTQMGPGQGADWPVLTPDWTFATPGPHYPPPYQPPDPLQPQAPSTSQTPSQDGLPQPNDRKDILPACSPASSTTTEDSADYSYSYSPTTPPPVKPRRASPPPRNTGHLSVHGLTPATLTLLEKEYNVDPDAVEINLRCLPDGAPVTAQHLRLTAELRDQLHLVPVLPLNLRKRLRRVRHGTYAIRKGDNKRMHRAQLRRLEQQVLELRGQVCELTQARDTLQQQLNAYEATQEEVDALKTQLANYRRLRMPAYGFEGL